MNAIKKELPYNYIIKPVIRRMRIVASQAEQFHIVQNIWWFFVLTSNITWLVLSFVHLYHLNNFEEFIDIVMNINGLTQVIFGQIACRFYDKNINDVLNTIQNEFWFNEDKYKKEIYKKHNLYYQIIYKVTKTYQITWFVCTAIWFFNPNIIISKKFPYDITFPFNNFVKKSPFYEITYALQVITAAPCALCILLQDVLYCTSMGFAMIQIDFIKYKLNNIVIENASEVIINKELNECIIQHDIVLNFLRNIELIFKYLMLNKFLCDIICVCGCKYTFVHDKHIHLKLLFIICLAGVQPLLYCFFGDYITSECESIGQQAYKMGWEKINYKSLRFSIRMMIRRSQKPLLMTAGGMIVLCLPTYVAFMKMMFSFYVLLENMEN